MGREKDVGSWPRALMMHYPTVTRASVKEEWHHEANSLSLIKWFFFQVARMAKQGPGVSGPYIILFFIFKMKQTFSQKLFAPKNDDKMDDYVCLNVDSLTRTKPV